MSSSTADGGALDPTLGESLGHEGDPNSMGDSTEAILMLAEWMMDDLAALAQSFHLNPDNLFGDAVSVCVEALGKNGAG